MDESSVGKEGFYSVVFAGVSGSGAGVIVLDSGIVVGADVGGATYDGTYVYDSRSQCFDMDVKMTVPPGTQLVTGQAPQSGAQVVPISVSLPRDFTGTHVHTLHLPTGAVNVRFTKLRGFP